MERLYCPSSSATSRKQQAARNCVLGKNVALNPPSMPCVKCSTTAIASTHLLVMQRMLSTASTERFAYAISSTFVQPWLRLLWTATATHLISLLAVNPCFPAKEPSKMTMMTPLPCHCMPSLSFRSISLLLRRGPPRHCMPMLLHGAGGKVASVRC